VLAIAAAGSAAKIARELVKVITAAREKVLIERSGPALIQEISERLPLQRIDAPRRMFYQPI
jgi:hypothetical protein